MKKIKLNQDLEIGDELGYELWYGLGFRYELFDELKEDLYWNLERPIRNIIKK